MPWVRCAIGNFWALRWSNVTKFEKGTVTIVPFWWSAESSTTYIQKSLPNCDGCTIGCWQILGQLSQVFSATAENCPMPTTPRDYGGRWLHPKFFGNICALEQTHELGDACSRVAQNAGKPPNPNKINLERFPIPISLILLSGSLHSLSGSNG